MANGLGDPPRARPSRGRIRAPENTQPPLWFGLAFALVGAAILALGLIMGSLVLSAGGLFFGVPGIAISLSTLRASASHRPFHPSERPAVDVFTRSPMRILMDLVLAPIGGIAFIGGSFMWLAAGPVALVGTPMFLFFGILMLRGAAITVRRGVRRAIAEVGPDGIWTPELPRRLAWNEIERVEAEIARGSGGDGLATHKRLGIWPRSRELAERAPGRGATAMVRQFVGLVNATSPQARVSDPAQMAPFGISAFEIEQDFPEVLRSVGRYATVVGAPETAGEPIEWRMVPPAPPPDGLLGAVAGEVARVAGSRAGSGSAPRPEDGDLAKPPAPPDQLPTRFKRRRGGEMLRAASATALPAMLTVVPIVALALMVGTTPAFLQAPIVWPFLLIPVLFAWWGVTGLLGLPARLRMLRGDPVVVTVDHSGIEMRGMGHLAWSDIVDVHVGSSTVIVSEGQPPVRRLEIVPRDPRRLAARPRPDRAYDAIRTLGRRAWPFGRQRARTAAFGLDLDLVEDPEALLDAIAAYRVVDET